MKRWRIEPLTRRGFAVAALAVFLVGGWLHEMRGESQASVPGNFSRTGLERIGAYLHDEVVTGNIPGAVLLIQQHGKPVYFESFGVRDPETGQPMTPDSIFQIYSMSKAVTSVAAMIPYRNTFVPLQMRKSASIFPMKQENIRSSSSR